MSHTKEELQKLYDELGTIRRVATSLGKSFACTQRLLKKIQVRVKEVSKSKNPVKYNPKYKGIMTPAIRSLLDKIGGKERLHQLYLDKGLYKLAKFLDVSYGKAQYLLKISGIPATRGHRDAIACNKGKKHQTTWKWSEIAKNKLSETRKALFAAGQLRPTANGFKGKTWDEIFGEEKAEIMRQKLIERIKKGKNSNTSIEIALQKELTSRGIIFETHQRVVLNKKPYKFTLPDIFIEPNICVYADGDYWHNLRDNAEKDKNITSRLQELNYKVLRFREKVIRKNPAECVSKILETIK